MTKLSVSIMAHPRREAFIPGLLASLDRPATVVWDNNNDRWSTGSRSLQAHAPDATHILVVQDDAVVCRDLCAAVEQIVTHHPEPPVCLYTGKSRPYASQVAARFAHVQSEGRHLFEMEGPWWGVGVAVPVSLLPGLLEWAKKRAIPNYDMRMARYFGSVNIPCLYTVPSLVDHRQDHESLIPGRVVKGRVAHQFIGERQSALTVDWSLPAVTPSETGVIPIQVRGRKMYACWYCPKQSSSEYALRQHARRHEPVSRRRPARNQPVLTKTRR